MYNQKIKCNVTVCKHHNSKECQCDLSSITVTNDAQTPTAHFCQQYDKK